MTTVCIVQEGPNGRGMSIVKVRAREVLVHAALAAIDEASARASAEPDPKLALIHQHEAQRLTRTLTDLVPELRCSDPAEAMCSAAGVM